MIEAVYAATLYTGKTWERNCQKQTSGGTAVIFAATDTLRAQIRETPEGAVVASVSATITDFALGKFRLLLTDEETAKITAAKQFGVEKTYWLDVDTVKDPDSDGRIFRLLNIKLAVRAGVTEPEFEEAP